MDARYTQDLHWMHQALRRAHAAQDFGEVPVGAVLVRDGCVIGEGYNQPIGACDPSAHAEIMALRDAARRVGNYRLPSSTLYVTLEPCPMCAGALVHARVARVVAATPDPRGGAAGSAVDLFAPGLFNHDIEYAVGVLREEASSLLQGFFRVRRANARN
jgi:tRNA(adenine34) deaminase